jgi:hypothetical protein
MSPSTKMVGNCIINCSPQQCGWCHHLCPYRDLVAVTTWPSMTMADNYLLGGLPAWPHCHLNVAVTSGYVKEKRTCKFRVTVLAVLTVWFLFCNNNWPNKNYLISTSACLLFCPVSGLHMMVFKINSAYNDLVHHRQTHDSTLVQEINFFWKLNIYSTWS